MFWSWLLFAGSMMPGGRLGRRETELVILRVATLSGSEYELTQHRSTRPPRWPHRRRGRPGRLPARTHAGWSDGDRLLLRVADELHATEDLADATWTEPCARRTTSGCCLELVMLVGHYRMLATALTTLRVAPDRARGAR